MQQLANLQDKLTESIEELRTRIQQNLTNMEYQAGQVQRELMERERALNEVMLREFEDQKRQLDKLISKGETEAQDFVTKTTKALEDAKVGAELHAQMLRDGTLDFKQQCLAELEKMHEAGRELLDYARAKFVGY